jgi:hypothetical protein
MNRVARNYDMLLIVDVLPSPAWGKGRGASRQQLMRNLERSNRVQLRRNSVHYYIEGCTVFKAPVGSAPFLDLG